METWKEIFVPSKTFLCGEYSVLNEGVGIVVATRPTFNLKISRASSQGVQGISPHSPAGQWIRAHAHQFRSFALEFVDPYEGKGGMGASTAQFIGVVLAGEGSLSAQSVWEKYSETLRSMGQLGSGADLLAQMSGGVSIVNPSQKSVRKMHWPFASRGFSVYKTEIKIPTHSHLKGLELNRSQMLSLNRIAEECVEALETQDWFLFSKAMLDFRRQQFNMNLLDPRIVSLIQTLEVNFPETLIRGCGAMGADTIAVFGNSHQLSDFAKLAPTYRLSALTHHEAILDRGWSFL